MSLKPEDDPYTLSLERALELIEAKKVADAAKHIKDFPDTTIRVLNGRFGPYVTDGAKNARIPKDVDPAGLALPDCLTLLENAKPAFGRGRGKMVKPSAKAAKVSTKVAKPSVKVATATTKKAVTKKTVRKKATPKKARNSSPSSSSPFDTCSKLDRQVSKDDVGKPRRKLPCTIGSTKQTAMRTIDGTIFDVFLISTHCLS